MFDFLGETRLLKGKITRNNQLTIQYSNGQLNTKKHTLFGVPTQVWKCFIGTVSTDPLEVLGKRSAICHGVMCSVQCRRLHESHKHIGWFDAFMKDAPPKPDDSALPLGLCLMKFEPPWMSKSSESEVSAPVPCYLFGFMMKCQDKIYFSEEFHLWLYFRL